MTHKQVVGSKIRKKSSNYPETITHAVSAITRFIPTAGGIVSAAKIEPNSERRYFILD
ncbi:MAG: hypothetical protein L6420_12350 [Elusimicrobia bacterium]|nr:hypothetical protein [Elusimicrobiota bacterium]